MKNERIIELGEKFSGGFGYWSHEIREGDEREQSDRAFITALREKGYEDIDIVFYGDWRDARHIADGMMGKTYRQMKKLVKDWSRDLAKYVSEVNSIQYSEEIKEIRGE